jgi:hypothetical protein
MTEPELIRTLKTAADGTDVALLTEGLFGNHRALFKRLAEYSIFQEEPLYRALRQKSCAELVRCSQQLCGRLSELLNRPIGRLDILIDAPPQHREVEFRVEIHSPSENRYRPLREVSPIVDSMARTQFDDCVKKVRLFARQDLRDELRQRLSPTQLNSVMHELL